MKRYTIHIALLIILSACSVTTHLERHQYASSISQLTKSEREEIAKESQPQILKLERDSNTFFLAPAETIDGEQVMSLKIDEVVVVSKMRSIPERNGEVTLDFVVTIPKELLGNSRNVVITPELHDESGSRALEELTIRGALLDKVQQRDYWQYNRYLNRFAPTELAAEAMFSRLVKFPRPTDARLDSLVENRSHITYYYSQSIKSNETTKRMKITTVGKVQALDNSIYMMPPSDTLSYTISSMLSFLDSAPRFRIKIVDKYVSVNDRNEILFRVGDATVIDTLGNNQKELDKISTLMTQVIEQEEFHVDTITLTATSSPEGSYRYNDNLARRRAEALKSYLAKRFGKVAGDIMQVKWIAEEWEGLKVAIAKDSVVDHRSEIVKIIETEKNPDTREAIIKSRYSKDYAYIKEKLYPQLRGVNFKYDLRRKGMVQDTIHTTELDTTYARGVRLLNERKYPQALYILQDYADRNTIIAHLSMEHNQEALQLLEAQPTDATTEYLKAIALSRLSRKEEGREAFLRACELEPRMEFRANLDPEITELLKP